MKLGRETGSLINHMMGNFASPTPVVGMPATICYWTDREPATVVEVRTPRKIGVKINCANRIDNNGMSEAQDYEYLENEFESQTIYWFSLTKDRRWRQRGTGGKGNQLVLGYREKYYDFSF
jgi:hypothetical protein